MNHPLPSLFLSHGSPMLALEDTPTSHFIRGLSRTFPRPRAILVASAHWETAAPEVMGAAQPATWHDFRGFPEELYQLQYPAAGSPELAAHVQALLNAAGIPAHIDTARPRDHGAWNPLLMMYPAADIPVIQLSVQPALDAAHHYRMGQALAPLRKEGVLILGSGNLTHNLREAFGSHYDDAPAWVTAFSEWVAATLGAGDVNALLDWKRAPHALKNHPTPEHFLPFFVALGAGTGAHATRLNPEIELGVLAMDAYSWA